MVYISFYIALWLASFPCAWGSIDASFGLLFLLEVHYFSLLKQQLQNDFFRNLFSFISELYNMRFVTEFQSLQRSIRDKLLTDCICGMIV